jgi:fructokinase
MKKRTIVGVGEVLWDLLPGGASLGGAPANFAYITQLLDDDGIVASRVGRDPLGHQALARMRELGIGTDHLQRDSEHPTGTVDVEIDAKGQARFEIADLVAWDFLEWTAGWQQLAEKVDAVCFGSLAQRSGQSRATIGNFLKAASEQAVKVFDVNLRQPYYAQEILSQSMRLADIVKVNDEELPKIMALTGLTHKDERSSAEVLLTTFDLKLVCVTRGGRGSLLARKNQIHEHPGFRVKVSDTVGSGDAFTAALVHEYLNGSSLEKMNDMANRVGAWVATQKGGMPVPARGFKESLGEITRGEVF